MRRGRVIAAAILWTAVVAVWVIFFQPGPVFMCLGRLGETEASCRAANGLPPLTEWDLFIRGPGPVAILLLAGWAVTAVVATRTRQRGGL